MKQVSHGLLWNGFRYAWKANPHRLSILGSRFEEYLFEKEELKVWHRFRSKIGNWPQDQLTYTVPYTFLQAEKVWLGTAKTRFQIRAFYNERGEISFSAVIPYASILGSLPFTQLKDPQAAHWMAFLNGFHIFPANNPSGWHFKELALQIGAPVSGKKEISVPITASVWPAKNPELVAHGNENWLGRPECMYNLVMDIFLVMDPKGVALQVPFRKEKILQKTGLGELEEPFSFENPVKSTFFAANRGFSIRATEAKAPGYYIRGMGMEARRFHEDPEVGKYISSGHLSFSNAGKWPLPWEMELALEQSLVTMPADLLTLTEGEITGEPGKGVQVHEQVIRCKLNG
ncbi:MAG: hypothetical protein H6581_18705 [Bacteroidia bacterium]|nr:hypothetical protein [Bacteroidia bacterium]